MRCGEHMENQGTTNTGTPSPQAPQEISLQHKSELHFEWSGGNRAVEAVRCTCNLLNVALKVNREKSLHLIADGALMMIDSNPHTIVSRHLPSELPLSTLQSVQQRIIYFCVISNAAAATAAIFFICCSYRRQSRPVDVICLVRDTEPA